MIKRKWPKIDRGGPRPPLRRQAVQGGSGLARHWFHGRFQASALPLVKLWAVLRSDSHPAGGVGPACRSIRGRIRASTGPLVGLALPGAQLQGGGRQPSPPAVRGGIWADPAPLGRLIPPAKPKSGAQTSDVQNASHGHGSGPLPAQAAGPLGKPNASQNCPQLYQGESEAWNRP